MENQHPPPFPFDAFDAAFENPADAFEPSDLFPASIPLTAGDHRAVLQAIRRKLQELGEQLQTLRAMIDRELRQGVPAFSEQRASASPTPLGPMTAPIPDVRPAEASPVTASLAEGDVLRVIEGVFDGQNMVGPDGKQYSVPANYASKSKLVEGDILKLRITSRGAFVYKQIGPIARDRRVGILERDDVTSEYVVIVPDADEDRGAMVRAVADRADLPTVPYKRYRTLRASVTYHHGAPGDEVVVLVPKDAPSTWAAVENIVKR